MTYFSRIVYHAQVLRYQGPSQTVEVWFKETISFKSIPWQTKIVSFKFIICISCVNSIFHRSFQKLRCKTQVTTPE